MGFKRASRISRHHSERSELGGELANAGVLVRRHRLRSVGLMNDQVTASAPSGPLRI